MDDLSVDEVRAALREYFADNPPLEQIDRDRDQTDPADPGFDRDAWRVMAEQLGLIGITAPEAWNGMGLDTAYAVAAVEECGAALCSGPVRASVLLALTLADLDPAAVPTEFTALVEGFLVGEVLAGSSIRVVRSGPDFRGETGSLAGRLTGRIEAVTHGGVAGLILTVATTAAGPAVVLAAPGSAAARSPVPGVDLATPLADVVVADAPAVLLTRPGDDDAVTRFRTVEALLLAAEQVGGTQGCLDHMVDYAKVREQFGVVIGTYQAISHRCATTAIAAAAARSLVASATEAVDNHDTTLARQYTLLARADAADAYTAASNALIQISGGIGFTWEHLAHLYFRRARATAAIGGTPAQLRDRAVEAGCLDLLLRGVA